MVIVIWRDAAGTETAQDAGTLLGAAGPFVIRADRKEMVLASQIFEDWDSRDHLAIPAGIIQRVIRVATVPLFKPE
jgi:hypothetical protein